MVSFSNFRIIVQIYTNLPRKFMGKVTHGMRQEEPLLMIKVS